ncbi:YqjF family protein [Halorientalis halophila]|uniref:YqjF family protein n=1 Tax=Halorientalis halophila TaxID=3108499 RepID=UPI00300BDE87
MNAPSLLRMRWEDVLFAHWAVEPSVVEAQLPAGLSADTYDGDAYLGVVGFRMASIRPRGVPFGRTFPELNLRTYVEGPDGPGIYFFNLDADDRLGVALARRLFRLPYYRAQQSLTETDDGFRLRSARIHSGAPPAGFDGTYRPIGPASEPEPASLEGFLAERYRFYVATDAGRVYVGPVSHPPWPLQTAELEIRENDLFAVNGFDDPAGDPLVHYSPGVDVKATAIRPVDAIIPGSG